MEHRDQVMEWTRDSVDLLERLLGPEGPGLSDDRKARFQHDLWWHRRYRDHLEMGGELLAPGDEWAMHHEHDLTVVESDDRGEIILFCRTCETPVWASVPDESGEGMAAKYAKHIEHDIRIRRDEPPVPWSVRPYTVLDIGLDCHTCQHVEGQDGIPLFSGVVSDWFLELWDG